MADAGFDFLAAARAGAEVMTRDRRRARLTGIAADECILGEVQMFGPCRWRADGRYAEAPGGAAGPLDLVAPGGAPAPSQPNRKTVTMSQALAGDGRSFCCD